MFNSSSSFGSFILPYARAWLTPPNGLVTKTPPQPCALTTNYYHHIKKVGRRSTPPQVKCELGRVRAGTGAFPAPCSDRQLQGATGVLSLSGFRFFASDSRCQIQLLGAFCRQARQPASRAVRRISRRPWRARRSLELEVNPLFGSVRMDLATASRLTKPNRAVAQQATWAHSVGWGGNVRQSLASRARSDGSRSPKLTNWSMKRWHACANSKFCPKPLNSARRHVSVMRHADRPAEWFEVEHPRK